MSVGLKSAIWKKWIITRA